MSTEAQKRLRSLLAAYNVFSAKLRHHKVPSGISTCLPTSHIERIATVQSARVTQRSYLPLWLEGSM